MKKIGSVLVICVFYFHTFSQVNELEQFRKSLTVFVNYDRGKIDTIPKTEQNSDRLRGAMERDFLAFALHPTSNHLDSLKAKGKTDGKATYWFNQWTYHFASLKINPIQREAVNNSYYAIGFSGLYDYNLSNFVSVIVQPFTIDSALYSVYYMKLNGVGTYYVKDCQRNEIVFSHTAFTSDFALYGIHSIDSKHLLIIESMGENGQRAFVVQRNQGTWKKIDAFEGNQLPQNLTDFATKKYIKSRTYLWIASTHTIHTHYGYGFFTKYALKFDPKTKTLFYVTGSETLQRVEASWVNNYFKIDDGFLGDFLINESPPMPDY